MRANEFVTEAPLDVKTRLAVDNWARSQNYQIHSSGSDARVFRSRDSTTSPVIKILLGSDGIPATQAAKAFLIFYTFCKKNPTHPNLPQFVDKPKLLPYHVDNVAKKEKVIYIKMEPLKPLEIRKRRIVKDMQYHIGLSWDEFKNLPHDQVNMHTWGMLHQPVEGEIEMWQKFYEILNELFNYYNSRSKPGQNQSQRMKFDMEDGGNVMQRSDGTPVIIDPFIF